MKLQTLNVELQSREIQTFKLTVIKSQMAHP